MMNTASLAKMIKRPENFVKNQKGLLVLGNGFDLDLQRKITFKDFYNSKFWPRDNQHKCPLDSYLEELLPSEYWYALEEALSVYVNPNNTSIERNAALDMPFYERIVEGMHKYAWSMLEIKSIGDIRKNDGGLTSSVPLAYHVFKIALLNRSYDICSFNYTELDSLSEIVFETSKTDRQQYKNWKNRLEYIHGSLATKDIILGAQDAPTASGYQLARKTNLIVNTKIVEQLKHVNQVVFFGHSLSSVDSCYFKEFFANVKSGLHTQCRSIIIITKDKESELKIKTNMQSLYGITWKNPIIEYYTIDMYKKQISAEETTLKEFLKEMETFSLLTHYCK